MATPQTINPMLTDAGLDAANKADRNGYQLYITHVALGSGKYNSDTLGAGMTALSSLKESVTIAAGRASGQHGFSTTVEFGSYAGTPYEACEIGFYSGIPGNGGVLVAVYSHPSEVLVLRNALRYLSTFVFQQSRLPAGVINVTIDQNASTAQAMIANHEAATDPHPQYIKRTGDTMQGALKGVTSERLDSSKNFATTEFVGQQGLMFPRSGIVGAANGTRLTADSAGRVVHVTAEGSTLYLPATSDLPVGAAIMVRCVANNATLAVQGSDTIAALSSANVVTSIPLTLGSFVTLVRNEDRVWYVCQEASQEPAGKLAYFAGVYLPPGWIEPMGQLVNRVAYSRLWNFAQRQDIIGDGNWQWYRGRFSTGTDASNFRLPDLRGVFLRSLDNGRGLDANRVWGQEQDSINKQHAHGVDDYGHSHSSSMSMSGGHAHEYWMDGGWRQPMVAQYKLGGYWTTSFEEGRGNPDWPVMSLPPVQDHLHQLYIASSGSNIYVRADGGGEARPYNTALKLGLKY